MQQFSYLHQLKPEAARIVSNSATGFEANLSNFPAKVSDCLAFSRLSSGFASAQTNAACYRRQSFSTKSSAVAASAVVVQSSARVSKSFHRLTIHRKTRQLTLCHPEMKADGFRF